MYKPETCCAEHPISHLQMHCALGLQYRLNIKQKKSQTWSRTLQYHSINKSDDPCSPHISPHGPQQDLILCFYWIYPDLCPLKKNVLSSTRNWKHLPGSSFLFPRWKNAFESTGNMKVSFFNLSVLFFPERKKTHRASSMYTKIMSWSIKKTVVKFTNFLGDHLF